MTKQLKMGERTDEQPVEKAVVESSVAAAVAAMTGKSWSECGLMIIREAANPERSRRILWNGNLVMVFFK